MPVWLALVITIAVFESMFIGVTVAIEKATDSKYDPFSWKSVFKFVGFINAIIFLALAVSIGMSLMWSTVSA